MHQLVSRWRVIVALLLVGAAVFPAIAADQNVRSRGAEITRILRESNAHPEALEKLRAYSFEEIWLTVRSYSVHGQPDIVLPARKALQLWPDWPERIWQRTERILAPARNPKREGPLDIGVFAQSTERAHDECVWLSFFLRTWVTPEVVRIVGPMLFEPGERIQVDDVGYGSPSGFAIAVLQDLRQQGLKLPESPESSERSEWQAWWRAHSKDYASTPPAAARPSETPATPPASPTSR